MGAGGCSVAGLARVLSLSVITGAGLQPAPFFLGDFEWQMGAEWHVCVAWHDAASRGAAENPSSLPERISRKVMPRGASFSARML